MSICRPNSFDGFPFVAVLLSRLRASGHCVSGYTRNPRSRLRLRTCRVGLCADARNTTRARCVQACTLSCLNVQLHGPALALHAASKASMAPARCQLRSERRSSTACSRGGREHAVGVWGKMEGALRFEKVDQGQAAPAVSAWANAAMSPISTVPELLMSVAHAVGSTAGSPGTASAVTKSCTSRPSINPF